MTVYGYGQRGTWERAGRWTTAADAERRIAARAKTRERARKQRCAVAVREAKKALAATCIVLDRSYAHARSVDDADPDSDAMIELAWALSQVASARVRCQAAMCSAMAAARRVRPQDAERYARDAESAHKAAVEWARRVREAAREAAREDA